MYDPRDYEDADADADEVRPPDEVVRERLLGGDIPVATWNPEADIDEEYMKQVIQSIEDECALEQIAQFERKERETHFVESKRIFARLSSIDKCNADIYETALSLIAMYEEEAIQTHPMNATDYGRFADILAHTRIPTEERERWNRLVSIEW